MPATAVERELIRVRAKPRGRSDIVVRVVSVAALTLIGCVTSGPYVWVDYAAPPVPAEKSTVLAPGELITIRVYQQPDMSTKTRVRNDGKVSVPFLNDIDAAGLTPVQLAQVLQTRLKEYINTPVVTISLDDPRPLSIPVTGEVVKPGVVLLDPGSGILAAIASASGLSPFATWNRIFVIRQVPAPPVRIRFDYHDLQAGDRKSLQFQLRAGDAVVVE